jgi:tRNA(Arg) A34 adenosine deaminase TadA
VPHGGRRRRLLRLSSAEFGASAPRVELVAVGGSLSSENVTQGRVRHFVRGAPLTYAWLVVLMATTLVQHSLSQRVLRSLLLSTSTNLHHLASDPLRVLVNSLLWIDGTYWWPYVVIFTLFLAPAEHWLGHLRWLGVGLICHVGATAISEGFLYWTISEEHASPRLVDARDVGVSYFVVGIAGVLFYRLPRRWRWWYLGALVAIAVGALVVRPNFTSLGHLCALALGLACYPLTLGRRRPTADYTPPVVTDDDELTHLRRCVQLAREALDGGNQPFGSLLVDAEGVIRIEERNLTSDGDHTQHPEFTIARWSTTHLSPVERAAATVYTSGEHCPMCAAAHAWVGLGRIVYAASTEQLSGWLKEWGLRPSPVAPLPITAVAPGIEVAGPAPELTEDVKALYRAAFAG